MQVFDLVVHSDWSKNPKKRWATRATWSDGRYVVTAPEQVGPPATFVARMREWVGPAARVIAGFDFPIGIPAAYAKRANIASFIDELANFGHGVWADFYSIATLQHEISVHRPFYPSNTGGREQAHLVAGLGVNDMEELMRQCERRTAGRGAACCLFWTLGGNQVGRAAIEGWRQLIIPALAELGTYIGIWPFHGDLDTLATRHTTILVETYPKDVFSRIGFPRYGWSKGCQTDRQARGQQVLAWLPQALPGVTLEQNVVATIQDGFGPHMDGEDKFDSFIGLLGMLQVVLGLRAEGAPNAAAVRNVEGWIFGQI